MRRLAILWGLALATACGPNAWHRDADGDGAVAAEDCDDSDPRVHRTIADVYLDADGDGHGTGAPVSVCAGASGLPAGYAAVAGDCDDSDPAAWQLHRGAYVDADGDGKGGGAPVDVCGPAALPPGHATVAGDCDDGDATRWQELAYLYRDADVDGVTVASAGVVCTGASLPAGYSMDPSGVDCDDADAARWLTLEGYADSDRDGVGAGAVASFCTGGSLPPGTVASGTDCAPADDKRWQVLAYSAVDGDGDGATVAASGSVCAGATLPDPYRAVASGNDCDDADRGAWRNLPGYADADRDGVGAGPLLDVCSGTALRTGYAATGTDCAKDDPLAWRSFAYSYVDVDGDGRTVASAGTLCIGETVPAGWATVPSGNDCNDADRTVWASVVAYADADTDGVGAGSPQAFCTDGTIPSGFSATATDCAPGDPLAWRQLPYAGTDADGDGFTTGPAGQVCAGLALPEPYRSAAAGNDCDDADAARWRWVVVYADADGDGVGAPPRSIPCLGATLPPGTSTYGFDVDDANAAVQWDGADEEMIVVSF